MPSGFELSSPDPPAEAFETVCDDLGANGRTVVIPQVAVDGHLIDASTACSWEPGSWSD